MAKSSDSMSSSKKEAKLVEIKTKTNLELTSSSPKHVYAIPNIVTTAGLFAGFYAIMQAGAGKYEAACIAIYFAMIMDILDGRLARLLNLSSDFGAQYDSMADMMSFGIAPALVIHQWSLHSLGKVGALVTFVYIAFAALRLARFNSAGSSEDKRFFMGLASPAAAGLVISAMYVAVDYKVSGEVMATYMAMLVFVSGILMFTNVQYRSFKDFSYRERIPLIGMMILVLVFAAIYFHPPVAFLIVGGSYFLSGLVSFVWHNRTWVKKVTSEQVDTIRKSSKETDK